MGGPVGCRGVLPHLRKITGNHKKSWCVLGVVRIVWLIINYWFKLFSYDLGIIMDILFGQLILFSANQYYLRFINGLFGSIFESPSTYRLSPLHPTGVIP